MTKEEIIAETTPHLSCPPDYLDVVTAELLRRLPDLAVKTCDDFGSHSGKCCESCHNFYPHYIYGAYRVAARRVGMGVLRGSRCGSGKRIDPVFHLGWLAC
jgi:hypothetical protein